MAFGAVCWAPEGPRLRARPSSGGRVPKKRRRRSKGVGRRPKKRKIPVSFEENRGSGTKKENKVSTSKRILCLTKL